MDSLAGDDRNGGTTAVSAWKSLSRVNTATFSGGDRILFKSGGTWTGQLSPKGSGIEQHPIVIDKYGGEAKPIINAAGTAEDAVLIKNQEYWEINNLEVTNTGQLRELGAGFASWLKITARYITSTVQGLDVHDVNGSNEVKENGGITYHCVGDKKPSRFVDLRIENNHIHHVDRSGIFGWSTHWMRSKWYPSLGVVIRNNLLDDIGGDGIVNVATDGAVVEFNVVAHASQRSQDYNVGIWPWSADNTIVQFNEVYSTRGQHDAEGFDSDWNSRNTIIQYNYSHDNEGGFLADLQRGIPKSAGQRGEYRDDCSLQHQSERSSSRD